ncbi:MAG: helix-turn-helix domain-containing protein [Bacilli bacterium]
MGGSIVTSVHEAFHIHKYQLQRGESLSLCLERSNYIILYIASGEGLLQFDEEDEAFTQYHIFLKHIETKGRITAHESSCLYVMQSSEEFQRVIKDGARAKTSYIQSPDLIHLWNTCCMQERRKENGIDYEYIISVFQLLEKIRTELYTMSMMHIKSYIKENLCKPLVITELAKKVGMTSPAFTRAFKRMYDISPKEYLLLEKMKLCKTLLLQNKEITLRSLSEYVGFSDEFHCSKQFKNRFGIAPAMFQQRFKKRIGIASQMFLQDHLLSLGIQPIVAPSYPTCYAKGLPSYLEEELIGTYCYDAYQTLNVDIFEKYAVDTVLHTPMHVQSHHVIQQFQGTVHCLQQTVHWETLFRSIAVTVDKEKQCQEIIAAVHRLEEHVKMKIPSDWKKGTWSVLWLRQTEIRMYHPQKHPITKLLFEKWELSPYIFTCEDVYEVITIEMLATLDVDHLYILWSAETEIRKIEQHPSWNQLKAVKNRSVYIPRSKDWDPWGPIGREKMLHDFSQSFDALR